MKRFSPWCRPALFVAAAGMALAAACASAPSPAPQAATPFDGHTRLDRSVVPLRYALDLDIDPAKPKFTGKTRIRVKLARETAVVRMHAEGLAIKSAVVRAGGQRVAAAAQTADHGGLVLALAAPVPAGEAEIALEYEGPLEETPVGIYRVSDAGHWYVYTQFEPLEARRAFPCFDQPEFKTPYSVTMRVPEGQLALANARQASVAAKDGRAVFRFAETPPLPTYLVAFAAGPLEVVPLAGERTPPLRVVTVQGKGALADFALRHTPRILQYLNSYFGSSYPFDKLDLVAVPNFSSGAMENPGLVTFREALLLLDARTATASDQLRSLAVIAHELAHIWFGDLVTLAWWDDLWLNEAFATWMSFKTLQAVTPELEPMLVLAANVAEVMELDAQPSARAIRQPIQDGGDVYNAFDPITYSKGAGVLAMLEAWMGEAVFQKGVRSYLDARRFGTARTADLLAALAAASGRAIAPVAGSFADQPGVPLVEISWRCAAGAGVPEMTLKQSRFAAATEGPVWQIPVCVRYGDGMRTARECVGLTAPEQTFPLTSGICPAWLHGNASQAGYYRWRGPAEGLRRLLEPRAFDGLETVERVAMAGELWALLETGQIAPETYLDAIKAMAVTTHWLVREQIVEALHRIDRHGASPANRAGFERFAREILDPMLEAVGAEPAVGEPATVALLRPRIIQALGALGRDETVLARAQEIAERFAAAPASVPLHEAEAYLGVAAMAGGPPLWERLRRTLDMEMTPGTRVRAIFALGAFGDPALLSRSYGLLLDGTLRAQDSRTVFAGRDLAPAARGMAFAWVRDNYAALVARIGEKAAPYLPFVASNQCDAATAAGVRAFFDASRSPPGTSRNVALTVEGIERCERIRKRIETPVSAYFERVAAAVK